MLKFVHIRGVIIFKSSTSFFRSRNLFQKRSGLIWQAAWCTYLVVYPDPRHAPLGAYFVSVCSRLQRRREEYFLALWAAVTVVGGPLAVKEQLVGFVLGVLVRLGG